MNSYKRVKKLSTKEIHDVRAVQVSKLTQKYEKGFLLIHDLCLVTSLPNIIIK